jgi:tRNA-Thr(GGU) m(6)t(6)A37 methyltransferase TsaA
MESSSAEIGAVGGHAPPAALPPKKPIVPRSHTALVGAATFTLSPIGFIESPFVERFGTPRQPFADGGGARGSVRLTLPQPAAAQALQGVEGFSHVHLITFFHLNTGWRPTVKPPGAAAAHGVFATRAPHRPNSLGLSTVRVVGVDHAAGVLAFEGCDLLDGTPVLDIKPYVPYCDGVPGATAGWLEA